MIPKKISGNDFLFHPAHGLCRVDRAKEQDLSGQKVMCYSLVPKVMGKMKVRFLVAVSDVESSGFHRVISAKEAGRLLDFLKGGDDRVVQTIPAWALARNILFFSRGKVKTRDQRQRKAFELSVKGLVGELACVFKTSLEETAERVRRSLESNSKINRLAPAAFALAAQY